MFIQNFYAQGFKILKSVSLDFHPRFNIIIGNNGLGKTTILDALYVLATAYSISRQKDQDLLSYGEESYELGGTLILHSGFQHQSFVRYEHKQKKKRFLLDHKKVASYKDLLEKFPIVSFSPFDIQNILGEPQYRRKFFNRMISYLFPPYYQWLKEYNHILKEKNTLLRLQNYALLEVWNERLIDLSYKIITKRIEYIDKYNTLHQDKQVPYPEFMNNIVWKYKGSHTLEGILKTAHDKLQEEKNRRMALWGPHRDDIVMIDKKTQKPIRNIFSLGQIKWSSFYLKCLEIQLMNQEVHSPPPFLIDDIFSELDQNNQQKILRLLEQLPNQMILTSSHLIDDLSADRNTFLWEHPGQIIKT